MVIDYPVNGISVLLRGLVFQYYLYFQPIIIGIGTTLQWVQPVVVASRSSTRHFMLRPQHVRALVVLLCVTTDQ